MATQSITLDELLTMIKNAKIKYTPTELYGYTAIGQDSSGSITLKDDIRNYDFVSIEAGDNSDDNPDNSLSLRLVDSITLNRSYCDIGLESNGTWTNGASFGSAVSAYMFTSYTTMKIISAYNHNFQKIIGWKSSLDIGGGGLRPSIQSFISSVTRRCMSLWHKLV